MPTPRLKWSVNSASAGDLRLSVTRSATTGRWHWFMRYRRRSLIGDWHLDGAVRPDTAKLRAERWAEAFARGVLNDLAAGLPGEEREP